MQINWDFIKTFLTAIAIVGASVGAFVTIKVDIATLQQDVTHVSADVDRITRLLINKERVAERFFE